MERPPCPMLPHMAPGQAGALWTHLTKLEMMREWVVECDMGKLFLKEKEM